MGRYTRGGIGRDVIAGALAGAAAVWIVDKLDWSLYRAGGQQGIRQTEAARPGGMDPAHAVAAKAADKLGVDIGDPKDNPAGHAVHYGFGIGRGYLQQGRRLLEQGLEYVDKYGRPFLEQGREYAEQGGRQAREYARQGKRAAEDYADQGGRQARDYSRRGRRAAQEYAEEGSS